LAEEVSIGELFETLEKVRTFSAQAAQKSTEFYERDIAHGVTDLGSVVADILYLLREHLSCHDCRVVDHNHYGSNYLVDKVLSGEMRGGEDASEEGTAT
jgi:hypothetical protein